MDRIKLLQYLIERRGYQSYLEIGVQAEWCFRQIDVPRKVGVDPVSGGTHRMTSDEYFALASWRFDLIFIDGDHRSAQVWRDAMNALSCVPDHGAIVLHDAMPANEAETRDGGDPSSGAYTGDVWRAVAGLRCWSTLDVATGAFDHGCTVVLKRPNRELLTPGWRWSDLTWRDYQEQAARLVNVMPWDALTRWLE